MTLNFDTLVVRAGDPDPRINGAVVMPIFQTAMYEYWGEADYASIRYIRLNNTPNARALGEKVAALEKAEAGLVTSSGMAAISSTLLTVLKHGDHLLAQQGLYGGTHTFITQDLPDYGIRYDLVDSNDPSSWAAALQPTTRAFYVEAVSNPTMRVPDIEAVVRFCREHNLLAIIDNTFPTPLFFRPVEHGFDIVLHSATKYLNGHSDLVAGVVVGRGDVVQRITHRVNHLGGSLDPHACFLLQRGLKTLSLRVRAQAANAMQIAQFLAESPRVKVVHYPGLPSHPQHERARRLFDGFGGMLSFEVDGDADAVIRKAVLPVSAPSLGGVESLLTRPATTSHAGLKAEERRLHGISDSLIRMSVGIESAEDLIADLAQALS